MKSLKAAIFALVLCFSSVVLAVPVNIKWDSSVSGGSYRISGPTESLPKGPQTADLSTDLADGVYRLTGSGFDFSCDVRNGSVLFKHGYPSSVNWDKKTNTFTFNTATLELDLGGYALPVVLRDVTKVLDPKQQIFSFKVICGQQKLLYSGGLLNIDLDQKGNANLPDNPGGFELQGNKILFKPRAYSVEFAEGVSKAFVQSRAGSGELTKDVQLMPTSEGYSLTIPGTAKGKKFELHVDPAGQLSARKEGPYSPVTTITDDDGRPLLTVSLPGGKEYLAQKSAELASAKVLQERLAKAKMIWQREFVLTDAMKLYNFPEEVVDYEVRFDSGKVKAEQLALVESVDGGAVLRPLQVSQIQQSGGFLTQARVHFRASLPAGTTKSYRLIVAEGVTPVEASAIKVESLSGDRAVLTNDLLRVTVPSGKLEFSEGKSLNDLPGPILGLQRIAGSNQPMLAGRFTAPPELKVKRIDAGVRENGPVFLAYSVRYELENNRTYEVKLTLGKADDFVAVDELITGFTPDDNVFWQIDFKSLDPTRRQAMSNGGYEQFSGAYDKGLVPDIKRLPFELGLYTANSLGVMRSAAFWNESGSDGLLVSLRNLREWKTAGRDVWASRGLGTIRFHQDGASKYFRSRLQGEKRFWALAAIPREAMVNRPLLPGKGGGAGPEVRLWQKLGDFSLNAWKDRVIDWDEPLDAACYKDTPETTYDEWIKLYGPDAQYAFLKGIIDYHWDYSSTIGPVSFRNMPNWFGRYARSRANWTPEQRRHVRSILLMMAYSAEDDNNLPHHSMLSGHPNFAMDHKATIAIACAVFPNHPDAKKWRDSFLKFFNEWITTYQRSDDPANNALGGRWTENLVCYSGQAMVGVLDSHKALMSFDGTDLINSVPRIANWVRWVRDVTMSPHDGLRLPPPEGAHARSFEETGEHSFRSTFFEVAAILGKSQPELAAQLKWIETNGKEGKTTPLKSVLLVDHGPVFRHDYGGPNESYLHIQNIAGPLNYRWSNAGILYYGAKGKVWSYNLAEDNGDEFNWNRVSGFSVRNRGLKPSPSTQPLYDFDWVQYIKLDGEEPYKSRSVMMVRDQYIAIADEVTGDTEGQFVWATTFDQPKIYSLKPATTLSEYTANEPPPRPGRPPARTVKCSKYVGKGSFLTVVAPESVDAKSTDYGATVNGEHIFQSSTPLDLTAGPIRFQGKSGYAAPDRLALFDGHLISNGNHELRREGGNFGISARWEAKQITGTIVGRSGGQVSVSLPTDAKSPEVRFQDAVIPWKVESNRVTFDLPNPALKPAQFAIFWK